MSKTLNQIIFFSSTKIRIFFSATLGIRIFFLEKNHNPPPTLEVKWSVPKHESLMGKIKHLSAPSPVFPLTYLPEAQTSKTGFPTNENYKRICLNK